MNKILNLLLLKEEAPIFYPKGFPKIYVKMYVFFI